MEITTGAESKRLPSRKYKRTSTTTGRTQTLTELPDVIITDILSRLPTKSVFASRCVCKSFLNLTTSKDSDFANLHFSRSHTDLMIDFQIDNCGGSEFIQLVDMESDTNQGFGTKVGNLLEFALPECVVPFGLHYVNSCRGLLCLKKSYTNEPSVICNPLTGEYLRIPPYLANFWAEACGLGLGFCPSTNQFKVLRISTTWTAHVHVVGSNSWRDIGVAPFAPLQNFNFNPFFLNFAIHWICIDTVIPEFILSFDFESEMFGHIALPPETKKRCCTLGLLGGCLALCDVLNEGKFNIWVMKEYGVHESWSKDFFIDTAFMELPLIGKHRPIKCLSNGEILLHSLHENNLVCYNPLKRSVKFLGFDCRAKFGAHLHTPSFVWLKDVIRGEDVDVLNVRSKANELGVRASFLLEYFSTSDGRTKRLP